MSGSPAAARESDSQLPGSHDAQADEPRVPRAVVVLAPRAAATDAAPPLAPGRAVIAAVSGPRGRALAEALAVTAVNDDDALPLTLGGLIDARALDAPADVPGALAHAKVSLWLAQRARPSLLEAARAGGAFFLVVTDLSQGSAVSAAVHGLLKTAALEWPEVACSVIDVDLEDDSALATAVGAELQAGFRDLEVVRDRRGRFVPVVEERAVSAGSPVVSERSVLVASGGARGVTATTLLALARSARPALLLLGRTPLVEEPACCRGVLDEAGLKKALLEDARKGAGAPPSLKEIGAAAQQVLAVREISAFLTAVQGLGGRAMYRAVDVRDVGEVAVACDDARAAFGPITGIVHGAGVLADKRIEDKTAAQVDRVMDTKVLGLHALLEATRADPLAVIALFSSVAGRFGNVGQVDYAMANEALNEMAVRLARHVPGAPVVKSFNWGPWEGGMVTPALKKIFAERGVAVLSAADGARHFVDELVLGDDDVEVVFGGELARPAAGPDVPARVAQVHLHRSTSPAYVDHAVGGVVVLPAAGALALMAGATGSLSFTDVRVLRGIKLPRFGDDGHLLDVHTARTADGVRVSLAEPLAKAPSYSALVALPLTQSQLAAQTIASAIPAGAALGTWSSPGLGEGFERALAAGVDVSVHVYGSLLFHGPRFQLVDAVDQMSDGGCLARVHGCLQAGWGSDLALDVGAIDAALQLGLLWARHRTGGAFLPTAIARIDGSPPRHGALRAVLRGRSCTDSRAVVDVQLVTAEGAVALSLLGVEFHRLANDDAFTQPPSVPTTDRSQAPN